MKKFSKLVALLTLIFTLLLSCSKSEVTTTIDNSTLNKPCIPIRPLNANIINIGTQVWATKNLDVSTYNDGTPIPQVTNTSTWTSLTTGAWCYCIDDPAMGVVYGKMYNWYAVAGIYDTASATNPALRKHLAPTGWHVPTKAEWTILTTCLGGTTVAGGKLKEAGTAHWKVPNTDATNSSSFTGLPCGYRGTNAMYTNLGFKGCWWSASPFMQSDALYIYLNYNDGSSYINSIFKQAGLSVRCIKD